MKSLTHVCRSGFLAAALGLSIAGCANGFFSGPKPEGIPNNAHVVTSGTPANLNFTLAPGDTVLIYDNVTKKVISSQTAASAETVRGTDLVQMITNSPSEGWDLNHDYTVYIVPAAK